MYMYVHVHVVVQVIINQEYHMTGVLTRPISLPYRLMLHVELTGLFHYA